MKTNIFICILVLFLSVLCISDVYSQEEPIDSNYTTEEIIITGTRTLKKIIDIPFSVERIAQRDITKVTGIGINFMFQTIPGIFTQSRYGNHDVRISIRGFGSRSNTGIRGVRILQDDIPESEPDGQTRIECIDFNALGAIEIVKGNASSLYTNAPGGVVNFKSDLYFTKPFVSLHNEFGSYGLRQNGFKVGVINEDLRFLLTYSYRNYDGYREHSQEYQNITNSVIETYLSRGTKLSVLLNSAIGTIKLPGSLNKANYNSDPNTANPTDLSRDSKRISRKGRLGIRFNTLFGKYNENEIEVTGYGALKDFDRTARTYRIFARYGIGGGFRYINRMDIANFSNEFSVGSDVYYQTGPITEYQNINGTKGDQLLAQTDETISNVGFYFQDQFSIIQNKLDVLVTGRYDNVLFDQKDMLLGVKSANRGFDKFTPKIALNYKFTQGIAAFTSYGLGFDTPAGNELDNYPFSSDNGDGLLNPDLNPQTSNNFEVGIKANVPTGQRNFLKSTYVELTFYNLSINNEIIPFVVDNTVFYRNAAKTNRTGAEFGLKTEIVKGLTLRSAYTYNDFKYKDYVARIIDANGIITDTKYEDNIVPSVPKHNISVDLMYEYNFSQHVRAFIKGNYHYIDKMYVNDANTENAEAYYLLNSMLGIDISYKGISLLAHAGINNILDKKYVAFININDANNRYYEAGPESNFFGTFNIGYTF
ncbi:MAG: TonB-dependent receptor [Ignavibacteria bacterium]|nr:TonB-dependent receptor [Ignavibacteria bacterium]